MNAADIRQNFFDFFESKGHQIVPSAPIVVKNDPTLMFTNAGMNQFKDIFLGNKKAESTRVANSQKCLRVSGKHNDLEEVGVDTYHHTMFEMLGNWSFGDYFKKEAIEWAWELLTEVYRLDKDRIYVSVFSGDAADGLERDEEAAAIWGGLVAKDRILGFNKKDNFWEMGDTGPCGPCSEIHVDLRSDAERKLVDGKTLVNNDHPQVIEIWNLVFIQYNRKADGSLETLPSKHVDTGMGFERLVRAINGYSSNYDTDVFLGIIGLLENIFKIKYENSVDDKKDIAFRVIADHIRAISFAIADGQLPSNTGAGYVIRRILRRAVRYGYSYLSANEPFLYQLAEPLSKQFERVFPELNQQADFVKKVIFEEEKSFLKTLSKGIDLLADALAETKTKTLDGNLAFELFDTYGFPIDLTQLVAREKGFDVDMVGFQAGLDIQKKRSKDDAVIVSGDWVELVGMGKINFIGYDHLKADVKICRYKKVETKGKEFYQLVFDQTPFYAESGGQVGDTGTIKGSDDGEVIEITDTKKENDLILHFAEKLPANLEQTFKASVDETKRTLTANNHSATHLLHAALRKVLGTHVSQKGSLVNSEYLRFDFSHFTKMTTSEIEQVGNMVNEKIKAAIPLGERRNVPIAEAKSLGAMALFGEKYGNEVRVITFDPKYSVELCGGIHVPNTSQIGLFKIVSETSVAAGVRRIMAFTNVKAEAFVKEKLEAERALQLQKEAKKGNQTDRQSEAKRLETLKQAFLDKLNLKDGVYTLVETINDVSVADIKDLLFQMKKEKEPLKATIAHEYEGKPNIAVMISESLVEQKGLNASNIVRELAKEIQGGGGGQPFFATAGGKNLEGLPKVIEKAKAIFNL
jgi:alanyl-tRNA synthetase